MELIGETDKEQGVTIATQRIKKKNGTTEEMVIGEFVYHPGHGHWHVDRYGLFQVYKYDTNRDSPVNCRQQRQLPFEYAGGGH